MKHFVKALYKYGKCFKYICEKFVHLTDGKLREGNFRLTINQTIDEG